MIDARNTIKQHLVVGAFTLLIIFTFTNLLEMQLSTTLGRTSFILLFLILIIGPIMKLKRPTHMLSPLAIPWSWRGELGIWFALMALVHFIVIWKNSSLSNLIKIGGAGYGLANLIGLIALLFALLLAATSFERIIKFLSVESWKWLHGLVYVIFYLVSAHFVYFQFFSTYGKVGPDWFGYVAVVMALTVILLQFVAFIVVATRNKKAMALKT